jgi:multidrug efflux pump subunit AcrA (membrane-fusion protein)
VPVVPKSSGDKVVAEAVIEPVRWVDLRFDATGQVAAILVSPGDRVSAGQTLMRLNREALELSLEKAQQEVVVQRAELDQLLNGASDKVVARAERENAQEREQAKVALRVSQLKLDEARANHQSSADVAAAEISAARSRVRQLERQLEQARAQDPEPEVVVADIDLERAKIALDEVQDEYNKALDRPWEPQKVRDGWAKELRQAELDAHRADAEFQRAQDAQEAHSISLAVVAGEIEEAQAQLARTIASQTTYTWTLEVLAADVERARLDLAALQAWENPYLDEPAAQEITQAKARLRQLELAVDEIELELEQTELRAPADGTHGSADEFTVVEVLVKVGDPVDSGQVVAVIATLDPLYARTVDLTELDVGRVAVGQPAEVSVDALAGRAFQGTVREISLRGKDHRGDVVYAVTIQLDDVNVEPPLRWGMTAMARIYTQ